MDTILLQLVQWFVERQIKKFGTEVKWDVVKADVKARLEKLLPGNVFTPSLEFIVDELIDMVASYCAQPQVAPTLGTPQMSATISSAMAAAAQNIVTKLAQTVMTLKAKA